MRNLTLRNLTRSIATAMLGTLLLSTPASAADMQLMSIEQMKAGIIGNSLAGKTDGGEDYVEHYAPDGRIIGLANSSERYEGRWSFRQDGLMCFKYGDGSFDGGCVRLSRHGSAIGITRVDGSEEPTAALIHGVAPELR
jgi:hypothetical protein